MTTVTVEQAKMQIGELIAAVLRGEEIVIETDGNSNLRLIQELKPAAKKTRHFGYAKDRMNLTYMSDDFDEFDEELQEMFADYIP